MSNSTTGMPNDEVPNAGEGVSDETEPEEEYEFDQTRDERDGRGGESVADMSEPDDG